MKVAVRAYDEFQSVFARFAAALEAVEKGERAVAAAADSLNKQMAQLLEAVQKTGPPSRQMTEEEKAKAEALRKAREEARQSAEATKRKAQADKEAADAAKEHKQKVDDLVQGLGALGILMAVKRGLEEVTEAGAGLNQELGIQRGLTGQAIETSQAFLMGLEGQYKGVTELSTGLNELARAGFGAQESMAALPELATFSTAAMGGLEKTMAPVVTILKVFQKDVRDTGEITDVLTEAANKSALGFDDFQLSLAMSAGVAKLSGMDYRELITVLSVLRDAGLGASDGGTSLKSALMALMNPSEEAKQVMKDLGIQVYDNQGRMKSWADIVANMEKALRPLNEQSKNLALTTIFGSDGVRAMALSMGRGSEYIRAMTADLQDSRGATAELANEMGNTFNGALMRTQVNLEKMKVLIFEDLRGAFAGVLNAVDTLLVGFNSLDGGSRRLLEVLIGGVGLTAALASVVTLGRTVGEVFKGLQGVFTATATTAGTASGAIAALGGTIGLMTGAVGLLVIAWTYLAGAQEKARRESEQKGDTLMKLSSQYEELQKVVDDSTRSESERTRADEERKQVIKEIGELFPTLVKRWGDHGNAVVLDTQRLKENTEAARENARAKAENALEKAREEVEQIKAEIDRLTRQRDSFSGSTNRQAMAKAYGYDPENTLSDYDAVIATQRRRLEEAQAAMAKAAAQVYGGGSYSEQTALSELQREKFYRYSRGSADSGPVGTESYDPKASKLAIDAEKERTVAIRDQMDLLRHLVAMDDERVDTASEQLEWLKQIRSTLGSTRDLEEAIHQIEQEILREPLQHQLDAFERRRQLGEVTAREEQAFYEDLVARSEELHLTERERQEYQVRAIVARKAADKELYDQMMETFRYNVDMLDASTGQQLGALKVIRDTYAEGTKERRQLDSEVHRLEKQLQEETHQARLDEIEFDAIVQRQTNDQKLAALREYLATAKDLTVEQRRDLQQTIAQMETQAEQDHQQSLLGLFREGLEAQRRVKEAALRAEQQDAEDKKRRDIDDEKAKYDGPDGLITKARRKLEILQEQSREIERQNRLLDLQKSLQEKDQELADVRKIKNRIVVEAGGPLGFTLRRTYDAAKERDLLKERSEIEEDLTEEKAKQARERQQKTLQEQIRTLEDKRDAKLVAMNQELADMRTAHGKQLEAVQTYWDDRLSTQSLQLDLEKTGWKNHYDDVKKDTEAWVIDMNEEWAKLQRPVFETGADLLKRLGGVVPPPGSTGSTSTSPAPASSPSTGSVKVEVNQYGDHNYNGVAGVAAAAQALVEGVKGRLNLV